MSQARIIELLSKQRLVEEMVHSQSMPRQGLVESLVHRQHLAELQGLMGKLPVREIVDLLETLPVEDAKVLWKEIPSERINDLLWEMPDELREQVAESEEPSFTESQMNVFELVDERLRQVTVSSPKDLEGMRPLWVDLLDATKAERAFVSKHFGLRLPDPEDTTDLEVSSRFHIAENDDIHLHSNFLLDREGDSRVVPVAFILHRGILFSVRNEDLPVFRLLRRRARTQPGFVSDCYDILLDLYGSDVEYSADSLEDIYETLGHVGRHVLSETMTDEQAAAILADIAEEEDLNGRVRSNILDTQRVVVSLMRNRLLSQSQMDDAKQILRNIESLNSHTAFLFDKINFLMDATIGFININQNKRVNKLTVFGVVFMPINILAGIGGMSEFSMMTQGMPWPVAYGLFIAAMGLLGWATFALLRYAETRRLRKAPRVECPGRSAKKDEID